MRGLSQNVSCGLLVLVALSMIFTGTSSTVVCTAVNGSLTDEIKEFVDYLHVIIVNKSHGRLTVEDGEEAASFDDMVDI